MKKFLLLLLLQAPSVLASQATTELQTQQLTVLNAIETNTSSGSAPTGLTFADSARNAYSSTNVTTGAWVQIDASTAAVFNGVMVFDSCGQTLELGVGAAASETRVAIIPPGGFDGFIPLKITAGSRLSLRAVSANCTVGEFDLTGLQ